MLDDQVLTEENDDGEYSANVKNIEEDQQIQKPKEEKKSKSLSKVMLSAKNRLSKSFLHQNDADMNSANLDIHTAGDDDNQLDFQDDAALDEVNYKCEKKGGEVEVNVSLADDEPRHISDSSVEKSIQPEDSKLADEKELETAAENTLTCLYTHVQLDQIEANLQQSADSNDIVEDKTDGCEVAQSTKETNPVKSLTKTMKSSKNRLSKAFSKAPPLRIQ